MYYSILTTNMENIMGYNTIFMIEGWVMSVLISIITIDISYGKFIKRNFLI